MDNVVMRVTRAMNKYLGKSTTQRLSHMDKLAEAFVISDCKHPAKRRQQECHKWLGIRKVERGVRAKQVIT